MSNKALFLLVSRWLPVLLSFSSFLTSSAQTNLFPFPRFQQEAGAMDSAAMNKIISQAKAVQVNDADSAVMLYFKLYHSASCQYNTDIMGTCLQEIALIYQSKGMYNEMLTLFHQALSFCNSSPSRTEDLLPLVYNGLANVYKFQSDYERSATYYYKAIVISEKLGDAGSGAIYNNMGAVLVSLERDNQALYYFAKAEQVALPKKAYEVLAYAMMNKGLIYMYRKDWNSSQLAYQAALQTAEKYHMQEVQFLTLTNIAKMYLTKRAVSKAMIYISKTQLVRGDINPGYRCLAFLVAGEIYYQLDDCKQARHNMEQAIHIARSFELGVGSNLIGAYELLAKIYEKTGHHRKSLEFYKTYISLRDSSERQKVIQNVNELEIKYRSTEKDKELMARKLNISQQENSIKRKNLLMGGISSGTILVLILSLWMYRHYLQKQKLQARQIFILNQEQEIGKFKALMEGEEKERIRIAQELHDGIAVQFAAAKMSVASLPNYHHDLETKPYFKRALIQLDAAIKELRKTAHNLLPDVLLEDGLVEAVYYFCNHLQQHTAMQIQFLSYGILPSVSKDFELQIYRIVQELVHNILKHSAATEALIQINYHEELLGITIKDNGSGFIVKHLSKGMGLRNVRTRVDLLKGKMEISSEPEKGSVFYLEFDIQHYRKQK